MSLSDSTTTKETLKLGSMENMRPHPEGKNKELALHIQGELGVRRTRARHLVRADTGKPNNQMKSFNNNGAKTDTPAGSNITSLEYLRDGQEVIRITVPAEGSQETTGLPGGQPKVPEPKRHKEQHNQTKEQNKDCSS